MSSPKPMHLGISRYMYPSLLESQDYTWEGNQDLPIFRVNRSYWGIGDMWNWQILIHWANKTVSCSALSLRHVHVPRMNIARAGPGVKRIGLQQR